MLSSRIGYLWWRGSVACKMLTLGGRIAVPRACRAVAPGREAEGEGSALRNRSRQAERPAEAWLCVVALALDQRLTAACSQLCMPQRRIVAFSRPRKITLSTTSPMMMTVNSPANTDAVSS